MLIISKLLTMEKAEKRATKERDLHLKEFWK